jgi:DNA-binding transcriptional regulator WhiA
MKEQLDEKMSDEIVDLYQQGYSFRKIEEVTGVPRKKCSKILKEKGLSIRSKIDQAPRKYKVDVDFFKNIDSQEKSYILGFLFADGNVRDKKCFRISLKYSDIDVLRKIGRSLNYTGGIKVGVNKSKGNWRYCHLEVSSKKMAVDLHSLGCIPAKTHLIRFPSIKHELIRHFVRGYFDGDGGIYQHKNGHYIFQITSNKDFIADLQNILFREFGITFSIKRHKDKQSSSTIYLSDIKTLLKIYDWLYKDATIYLARKHLKFEEIFDYFEALRNKYPHYRIPSDLGLLKRKYKELGRWNKVAEYYGVPPHNLYYKINNPRKKEKACSD